MTEDVEHLSDTQRQYLKQFGIDPDKPLGTQIEVVKGWIIGLMCNQEFLYLEDCDAQPGHSSHRGCGPNGCPFLLLTQPNPFDTKYLEGGANSFQDSQRFPVYKLPADRIYLSLLRITKAEYVKSRAQSMAK